MTDFTPIQSLIGGIFIGLSAVLLMALHGRVAGMTGILTGVIPPVASDWPWRAAFLAGAIVAPLIYLAAAASFPSTCRFRPARLSSAACLSASASISPMAARAVTASADWPRFSPRSLAAVATFMVAAFVTVDFVRHVIGG